MVLSKIVANIADVHSLVSGKGRGYKTKNKEGNEIFNMSFVEDFWRPAIEFGKSEIKRYYKRKQQKERGSQDVS